MNTRLGTLAGARGNPGQVGRPGQPGPRGDKGDGQALIEVKARVTTDDNGNATVTYERPFTAPPALFPFAFPDDGSGNGLHVIVTAMTAQGFTASYRTTPMLQPTKNTPLSVVYVASGVPA